MDALGEKLSVKVVVWAEDASSHFSERVEISGGMCEVSYETHSNRDSFLESLVSEDADIALVSMSHSDWRNTILDIPSIRTDLPVYLLGEQSANGERENFAEGIRIIYETALEYSPLPLLIEAAVQAKKVRHNFRDEKEGLIRQLFDLRDEQERTERQAADVVEMAENLEFSKSPSKNSMRRRTSFFQSSPMISKARSPQFWGAPNSWRRRRIP